MIPLSYRMILLASLAAGFLALFLLSSGQAAVINTGSGTVGLVMQQATDPYPIVTLSEGSSYPVSTNIPREIPVGITPISTIRIPTNTPTPAQSFTIEPGVFRTEDAEILDSLASPAASLSPYPSITPANTQTAVITSTLTAPADAGNQTNGLKINWGFFWIGFAVPILAGCGVVLYLLDRYPDLFTRRLKP